MDEKGLLAAAVTMIAVELTSMGSPGPTPILFKADHSFQMFIVDGAHENTLLFMGQINNPGIPEGSDTPQYIEPEDSDWIYNREFNISNISELLSRSESPESTIVIEQFDHGQRPDGSP